MTMRIKCPIEGKGITESGRAHAWFYNVPNWVGWEIGLDLTVNDGRPEVTGILGLVHSEDGQPTPLTTRRMASLPLQNLAKSAFASVDFRLRTDLDDLHQSLRESDIERKKDSRSGVTLLELADAYLKAHLDPNVTNVHKHLATTLHLAERTVAYKIKDARAAGLIPEHHPRRNHLPPAAPDTRSDIDHSGDRT